MDWTIHNDRQSVTVGINQKIWLCKKQGLVPVLIRLGKEHSLLFWKEQGKYYIPNKPVKLVSNNIMWCSERNCWVYKSWPPLPMKFSDPKIIGIVVDGVPKPEKAKKKST